MFSYVQAAADPDFGARRMTEWMLRRQGGRAVGPVPTRALVRGIKQGKVPRDTEAREVAGGTWMPLSMYDEFYDALGLDEDATRVVQTPWFVGQTADASELSDADEDEDEEATRVMEALSDSVLPPGESPSADAPVPLPPAAGRPAARAAPLARDDTDTDCLTPDVAPPPAPLPPPAPPARAAARPVDPYAATLAARAQLGDTDEEDAVTALMEAPSEQQPSLFDADADESNSSVSSEPRRAPVPAAGRPAHQEVAMRGGALAGSRTSQPRRPSSPTLPGRRSYVRAPQVGVERADEHTVPAMRYVHQINTRQTSMLIAVSIAFVVSLAAIVVLLLLR